MSPEQSRITNVAKYEGRDLGELRNALLAFSGIARPASGEKLDPEFVRGAAQHIVNAMREEIFGKLSGQPSDDQERYFREVLKSVNKVSDGRLKLPTYESLLQESEAASEVVLNENRISVRPLDRDSAAGGSYW